MNRRAYLSSLLLVALGATAWSAVFPYDRSIRKLEDIMSRSVKQLGA